MLLEKRVVSSLQTLGFPFRQNMIVKTGCVELTDIAGSFEKACF